MALSEQTRTTRPRIHVDFVAIGIALMLATLIRFNILPQIRW